MSEKEELPHFLQAIPRWHPGAWGPPAETVTLASMLVMLLAVYRLFRNEVVMALFKFQFNPVWLSLAAIAISGAVAWSGSHRPGSRLPRVWALVVAAFSFFLMAWAIYAHIAGHSGSAITPWENPRLHALCAVALVAALALAPRLFHVHPFSPWVHWAAPAALIAVAALCWASVQFVEGRVIRAEQDRLTEKVQGVDYNATAIQGALKPPDNGKPRGIIDGPQTTKPPGLEEVSFRKSEVLPSQFDWQRLELMHKKEDMRSAMSNALEAIKTGVLDPQDHKLLGPQPPQSRETWLSNDAERAAKYYRELGRLHKEIADAFQSSPFKKDYEDNRQLFEERLQDHAGRFSQQWIPALFTGKGELISIEKLLESHVGELDFSLGEFNAWKGLSHSQIQALNGKDGCVVRPRGRTTPRQITEKIPTPPSSATAGTTVTERVITVYDHWEFVECYAYRPNSDSSRVEMLAEVHLNEFYSSCSYEYSGCSAPSRSTRLQFYLPSGTSATHYQEQVTAALSHAHGRYRWRSDAHKNNVIEIEIE